MSIKRLLISLAIVSVSNLSFAQDGDDSKPVDPTLTIKEQRRLEQLVDRTKVDELQSLYAEYGDGSVKVDHSYMLERPLTQEEVLNFNHPYLQIHLSQLTEKERDDIIESIQQDAQRKARLTAVMNMGMRYGHKAGLYYEAHNYFDRIRGDLYHKLTEAYPFDSLMLAGGKIKPPLIEEIGYSETIEDKRRIRKIKKRYQIEEQAEVILKAPSVLGFFTNLKIPKPTPPSVYLLPINEDELSYWKKGVMNGWLEGVRYAHKIIRFDYREMARTLNGYVRFHVLHDRGVINMPSYQNLNVGTNAMGNVVNIGEGVFEITEMPQLNDNSDEWIALPVVDDIFDKLSDEEIDKLMNELYESGAM